MNMIPTFEKMSWLMRSLWAIRAILHCFSWTFSTPSVRSLVILTALLYTIIAMTHVILAYYFLFLPLQSGFSEGIAILLSWMPEIVSTLLSPETAGVVLMLFAIALFFISLWVGLLIANFLCEPLHDKIAQLVSLSSYSAPVKQPTFWQSFPREISFSLMRLFIYLVSQVILLIAGFTGVLLPFVIVGQLLCGAIFTLSGLWSYSFSHRYWPTSQRVIFMREHLPETIGAGMLCSILSWVPFIYPFLVVGATRLFCQIQTQSKDSTEIVSTTI